MKVSDLVTRYERKRAEAREERARVDAAVVYGRFLDELRSLDGVPDAYRMLTTAEAGQVMGLESDTVARRCARGEIPGAVKTSGDTGEWRIPAASAYGRSEPKAVHRLTTYRGTA